MKRLVTIGLMLAVALSLGIMGTALAHAKLVSSEPAAGAKLTGAPSKVTLVFDEEISDSAADSSFSVTDEQGAVVGTGQLDNTDLDHQTLSGALKSGLGDGVYTVSWKTLTTDDNGKSEGSFKFGVNKDPGQQPTAAPEHEEAAPTAAAAATQPTAAAAGAAPSTLPKTADGATGPLWIALVAAAIALAGGLALRRRIARSRR
ncbi:MAG: copper resistance protein CopC [Kouleothrix sp.]|nr:copper resistance protein CopC [Kouleothrix sp.]